MFIDSQKKFTMQELYNCLKKKAEFPQYMNRPIRLCVEDEKKEKLYLHLVGENIDEILLVFQPESYFVNDK